MQPQTDVLLERPHEHKPADKSETRSSKATTTVLLWEPRHLLRDCLACALREAWPEIELRTLPELGNGGTELGIDLAIASIVSDSIGRAGLTLFNQIRETAGDAPVAFLADRAESNVMAAATQAGVRAFIPMATTALPVTIGILQLVLAGGTYVPPADRSSIENGSGGNGGGHDFQSVLAHGEGDMPHFEMFTPREIDLLKKLKEGKPNKIIAYELGICESTAKVHMRHVMRKLNTTNRTQAALLAREMFEPASA